MPISTIWPLILAPDCIHLHRRRNLGMLEMEKRETTVQLKQSHFQDLNIETRHRAAFPLHPLNPLSFSLPFSLSLSLSLSFFLSQIDDFLPVELSSGTLGGEERSRERREAREHKSTRGNGMVQQEGRNE